MIVPTLCVTQHRRSARRSNHRRVCVNYANESTTISHNLPGAFTKAIIHTTERDRVF